MELSRPGIILFLFSVIYLLNTACGLTCGQTECLGGEYCCSQKQGDPKNCCCKSDITGFSIHCSSSSSSSVGLPWYGVLIIVLVVVAIAGAVITFIVYRRRRRNQFNQF